MGVRFERESLYEQVWSTPLTRLAPTYGLSDNGLRKVCKALNVPLPGVGHWARLAAGHQAHRKLLPTHSGPTIFMSYPPLKAVAPMTDPTEIDWLRRKTAEEKLPNKRIGVEREPAVWHPCLSKIRKDLHMAVVQHARDTKARQLDIQQRSTGRPPSIHLSPLTWQYLERGGLMVHAQFASFLRVSPLTCERALALANALLLAAEERGIHVSADVEVGRFALTLERLTFHIAIRERQSYVMKKPRPGWEILSDQREYSPTDNLVIVSERSGASSFEIKDTSDGRVEDRLNSFFIRLYRGVLSSREAGRRVALASQRLAEAAAVRVCRAEQEAQIRRAKEFETAQREELLNEAAAWAEAQRIRAYLSVLASAPEACRSDKTNEWIRWSFEQAEAMDPVKHRLAR